MGRLKVNQASQYYWSKDGRHCVVYNPLACTFPYSLVSVRTGLVLDRAWSRGDVDRSLVFAGITIDF